MYPARLMSVARIFKWFSGIVDGSFKELDVLEVGRRRAPSRPRRHGYTRILGERLLRNPEHIEHDLCTLEHFDTVTTIRKLGRSTPSAATEVNAMAPDRGFEVGGAAQYVRCTRDGLGARQRDLPYRDP